MSRRPMHGVEIAETTADDVAEVLELYPSIFPEEDLVPVVSSLLRGGAPVLSIAGFLQGTPVAHILFTLCGSKPEAGAGALLAPLGTLAQHRRQGLGSALVGVGLERLRSMGVRQVLVLGSPAYYGRFGFAPERRVRPPYPLPQAWRNAWQSRLLGGGPALAPGLLDLPPPWMDPALWAP